VLWKCDFLVLQGRQLLTAGFQPAEVEVKKSRNKNDKDDGRNLI